MAVTAEPSAATSSEPARRPIDAVGDPWRPATGDAGSGGGVPVTTAVAAGVFAALPVIAAVEGQGGITSGWAIAVLVGTIALALAWWLDPVRRPWLLAPIAVVVVVLDAVVAPTTGQRPVLVAVLAAAAFSVALIRWRPVLASWRARRPVAAAEGVHGWAFLLAALGAVLWATRRSPLALVAFAASVVLATTGQRGGYGARVMAAVDRALRAVGTALAGALLLLVALPLLYLPGAIARSIRWVRRRVRPQGPRWSAVVASPDRQRRDARFPFVTPAPRPARTKNAVGILVILGLLAVWARAPWDHPLEPRSPRTTTTGDRSIADRLDAVRYVDRAAMAGEPYAQELQAEFREVKLPEAADIGYGISDHAGKYVNTADGVRRTLPPDCPGCPRLTVWWTGGSVAFGVGNRDDHTIASELVRLAQADGIALDVENLAVPGYTLTQEVASVEARLQQPGASAPDLVIVLDGYNDTMASLMDVLATGHVGSDPALLRPERADALLRRTDAPTFDAAALGRRAASRYQQTYRPFAADLVSGGSEVVRFFQPDASSSEVQRHAVDELGVLRPDFFSRLKVDAVLGAAADAGPADEDLRSVLDDLDTPVYLDSSHPNELGAWVIAEAMYERLGPQLKELAR